MSGNVMAAVKIEEGAEPEKATLEGVSIEVSDQARMRRLGVGNGGRSMEI